MTTPQEQSKQLVVEITSQLTSSSVDLRIVLRKCYLLCNLLDWREYALWFDRELNGYTPEEDLPEYRIVSGVRQWQADTPNDILQTVAARQVGSDSFDRVPEPATLAAWGSVDWVISSCTSGSSQRTGDTSEWWNNSRRRIVTLIRVERFEGRRFTNILQAIERHTFKFVADTYKTIMYGEAARSLWEALRTKVESKLMEMGLAGHLEAITPGIDTNNPEMRRSAAFACRSLIDDIASQLWQDARASYDHLPGGAEGHLEVSANRPLNRLAAYLHQKGVTGTPGQYVRAEIERLDESLRKLHDMQSMGHDGISEVDMATVAFGTYALIAELVNRTNMEPIYEYGQPAVQDE